jgi:hypothetical protein
MPNGSLFLLNINNVMMTIKIQIILPTIMILSFDIVIISQEKQETAKFEVLGSLADGS